MATGSKSTLRGDLGMNSTKISADMFEASLTKILSEYSEDVYTAVSEEVEALAKEGVQELKTQSLATKKYTNRSGDYSKGWKKQITRKRLAITATLYNTEGQLTHLLENGHSIVSHGRAVGRTSAFPHIAPVQEDMSSKLEKNITRRLREV